MSIFDEDEPKKTEEEAPSKIKLGEKEYDPEELDKLVQAGSRLHELEEKQGQPIDDVLKSWGRRGEVIGEQKKQLEELEKKVEQLTTKPPTKEELSEQEMKEQVISEAKKFGLLTQEEAQEMFTNLYQTNRAGERIMSQAQRVIKKASKEGKPEVELEQLLEFMADPKNPKDPQIAYEVMHRDELKEWEKKQLEKIKNKGMATEAPSMDKQPERKVIRTRDGLKNALSEHFANFSNQ